MQRKSLDDVSFLSCAEFVLGLIFSMSDNVVTLMQSALLDWLLIELEQLLELEGLPF
jgi:hypothetical protein